MPKPTQQLNRRQVMAGAGALGAAAALPGLRAAAQDATPSASPVVNTEISGEVNVAMVGNPQMVVLDELLPEFNKAYPNVTVNNRIVPENEVRQIITQDISTQAGQFDVVTIGTFEVPLWGANGWLEPMDAVAQDPAYDVEDIFQAHRDGLSADGVLYGLPFYGESAMTFYRTDLFEAAGLTMPERPTFEELAGFARQLHKPEEEIYGIALRGLPGWGQQLAPLTCVINAYGGRWFDENWVSQLGSEKSRAAITAYITLLQEAGIPGADQAGFTECQTLMNQGNAAMWCDATSAAELVSDPALSEFADRIGFAYFPRQEGLGNWLWNWAFAIAGTSENKEAATAFVKWSTSKEYQVLVSELRGWGSAPTGARQSTYENPSYLEFAGDFADIVLTAIGEANPNEPTVDPVPYTGGQFVRVPEFQQLGDDVSREFAAAIVGEQSIDDAIAAADELANTMAIDAGYQS